MKTNDARCIREIKFRIARAKTTFNKNKSFQQQIGLKLRKELAKCYILRIDLCGAETLTLRKVD